MPLQPGTRLGPYEILSALGAGGMGEVYRARDMRLNRDVAIKVLPDLFASDAERLARFTREAQTLASLNHPNIAHIHGLEESGGVRALVMELVEGEDLSQRIAGEAIPLDEALPIARQIAEALEAAHEAGIIHRDLKPANIKLRPDGTVKVLDFGLAKALESTSAASPNVTASPTITTPAMMTGVGMILGTAAYMSPEQAKGRPADKRSDIWAFGAVLYEMLSGRRAFTGDDVSDTLAAVLRQDLEWSHLPDTTPAVVRRLIARCLDRDPKRRLRDIGEARIVLDDPAARDTTSERSQAALPIAATRPLWRTAIPILLTAAVAAAVAATAAWMLKPSTPLVVSRFTVTLPELQVFNATGRHMVAVSPDGTQIVYAATPGLLYRRSMSTLDARPIPGLDAVGAAISPVFSPDGHSVAFYANGDGTLKKIAVTGGTPVTLCPAENPFGMSWEGDAIVFGQGRKGLMRVSANGGVPEVLVSAKDGEVMQSPQLLPDGQTVLFTVAASRNTGVDVWDKANIVVQSLTKGERRTVVPGGSDGRYIPTGHLLYAVGGVVFAVPFDVRQLQVKGGAAPVIEGVRRASGNPPVTGAANFSVSRTGALVYLPGPMSQSSDQLEIVLATGSTATRLKLPPGPYTVPRVSPDGQRIAFGTDDPKGATVWVYELSGATSMRPLTFTGRNRFPIWTADSKRVVFQSDREGDLGVFATMADGSGATERLTKADKGTSHVPESWSPTGDVLAFSAVVDSDHSLWTFSMQSKKATPFDNVHSTTPIGAVFSPDGRWIAYTSTEQRTTVYVQPFPPTVAKYQMFAQGTEGPHHPAWAPNGKALFYIPRQAAFASVGITLQPAFAFGNPVPVPRPFNGSPPNSRRPYDITPDGKFIGLVPTGLTDSGVASAQVIEVVVHWFEELKARVPTK